jgi:hypothetical protein
MSLVASLMVLAVPMPGEAEGARFQPFFEAGEALYSRGEFGAAIALFIEADRARVTPEVAFDVARCFEKLGDRAFTVLYDRLYLARSRDTADPADVADVFRRVERAVAREEEEGLGYLEVFAPRATTLKVRGRQVPRPPLALFLPPGDYVVEGVFPSGPKSLRVAVRLGRPTSVVFEPLPPPLLSADLAAPPQAVAIPGVAIPGVAIPDAVVPAGPPTSGPPGLRVASYVVVALGVAALAAGATFGVLSTGDAALARDKALTVREAMTAAEAANGRGTVANVLFGAGAGVTLLGAALFGFSFLSPGPKAAGASR